MIATIRPDFWQVRVGLNVAQRNRRDIVDPEWGGKRAVAQNDTVQVVEILKWRVQYSGAFGDFT